VVESRLSPGLHLVYTWVYTWCHLVMPWWPRVWRCHRRAQARTTRRLRWRRAPRLQALSHERGPVGDRALTATWWAGARDPLRAQGRQERRRATPGLHLVYTAAAVCRRARSSSCSRSSRTASPSCSTPRCSRDHVDSSLDRHVNQVKIRCKSGVKPLPPPTRAWTAPRLPRLARRLAFGRRLPAIRRRGRTGFACGASRAHRQLIEDRTVIARTRGADPESKFGSRSAGRRLPAIRPRWRRAPAVSAVRRRQRAPARAGPPPLGDPIVAGRAVRQHGRRAVAAMTAPPVSPFP
jgi:hypothetical protein